MYVNRVPYYAATVLGTRKGDEWNGRVITCGIMGEGKTVVCAGKILSAKTHPPKG